MKHNAAQYLLFWEQSACFIFDLFPLDLIMRGRQLILEQQPEPEMFNRAPFTNHTGQPTDQRRQWSRKLNLALTDLTKETTTTTIRNKSTKQTNKISEALRAGLRRAGRKLWETGGSLRIQFCHGSWSSPAWLRCWWRTWCPGRSRSAGGAPAAAPRWSGQGWDAPCGPSSPPGPAES